MSPTSSLTDYHAKYFAYELTRRRPSDSPERLAAAVAGAQVDLNPHQVDAALFAFHSPLSKGALLADEVGLGKTIEAGLVLSQKWAERKRRLLVIVPSNLRKQWHQELTDKFFLPCRILESKSYNTAVREGRFRPFEGEDVVICSYHFAKKQATDVANTPWDLVVLDEAHRLRNVYKPDNVISNTLKRALANKSKLLLTATPLQNSILELFGLASFIDEHAFGDLTSFREQFADLSQQQVFSTLKARLKPICHRTLRRQVTAYVPYTKRHPILEPFDPEEGEDHLYKLVSEYLRREKLQALPSGQRSLMTLVLRKLLASSTFAIAGALETMSRRLRAQLHQAPPAPTLADELDEDFETLDETSEEWPEDQVAAEPLSQSDRAAIETEIADLEQFTKLATSITQNAKGKALLKALDVAFKKARELGADEKAIIFTESRKTQSYLQRLLADSPYAEGIVLFNGTNTDDRSKEIYTLWLDKNKGSDRVTDSKTADMRSALVDYFRDEGRIMIATEAGAEGINLQFCSLVVNYDLPWNPQRVEQRIGRCHRYGQKHDVVVVNFLNNKNEADQRVFQLLSEKFKLFEGVFGSSDEVLGAIESGVDFEKQINDIYQKCRKPEEIKVGFDQLQLELNLEINEAMSNTRRKLLENFDDEVREKLKVADEVSRASLNQFERMLMRLTRHELTNCATFQEDSSFELKSDPFPEKKNEIPLGRYELPRRTGDAHLFRLNHSLADAVIHRAQGRDLPVAKINFQYKDHEGKISVLEPLLGKSGWLSLNLFSIEALDQAEDHIIFSTLLDDGTLLDEEVSRRLLSLPGQVVGNPTDTPPSEALGTKTKETQTAIQKVISERNSRFFEAEVEKLESWSDDVKLGLEREIKDLDRQIKEARRVATVAMSLEEKLVGQKRIKAIESQRNEKRRSLFEAQDKVDQQREILIETMERNLSQKCEMHHVFVIKWTIQ